jgi:hypothetical protein
MGALYFALMLPHAEPYVAAGYTAARPSSPERKILCAAQMRKRASTIELVGATVSVARNADCEAQAPFSKGVAAFG